MNPHEQARRALKVSRLVATITTAAPRLGMSPAELVDRLEVTGWKPMIDLAGVEKLPSELTISVVRAELARIGELS